jgi:heme/copper-type cytochrome/quinol oxidase subunit 2
VPAEVHKMFFINSTVYLIIVAFSFVLISGLLIFVWKYTGRVEQQAAARQAQGTNNNNVDNVRGEESSGEEEEDDNVSHIQNLF